MQNCSLTAELQNMHPRNHKQVHSPNELTSGNENSQIDIRPFLSINKNDMHVKAPCNALKTGTSML